MSSQANPGPSWAADHVLTVVVDTDKVKVYRVGAPGTRMNSFEVAFTPEAICISGDYAPGSGHGVVARSRSVQWFVSATDPYYLAEKFLRKGYHAEIANDWLRDAAKEYEDKPEIASALLEIVDTEAVGSPERLRDAVEGVVPDYDFSEGGPWGYNPVEVDMLAVCQRVFARLYLPAPVPDLDLGWEMFLGGAPVHPAPESLWDQRVRILAFVAGVLSPYAGILAFVAWEAHGVTFVSGGLLLMALGGWWLRERFNY